jgi:hypothetical protein
MPYLANELITDSYYDAGIVSREFETVSGSQMAIGLKTLNEILTEKRIDKSMIPYETKFQIAAEVGQETYWIPNLISIDTLVFYLQNVRYSMDMINRNLYFGAPRVENILSLPNQAYFERKVGGGNLHIYFQPDRNYPLEIHGSFDLNISSQFQNLLNSETVVDLGIPTFYGLGSLNPGQLVVSVPGANGMIRIIDLMGNYPNIGALINYINTGIIPGVSAALNVNDLMLFSNTIPPTSIYIKTSGYPNGTSFLGNVAAATTTNLASTYNNGMAGVGATLTALTPSILVVDGYTLQNPNPATGVPDRVLVIDQTDPTQNGSYIISSVNDGSVPWVLTRTTNYDQSFEIGEGNLFTVLNGTINAGLTFIQTADVSVIGTSSILFSVFNALTFSNFSTIEFSNYQIFNPTGFDQFFVSYLQYAVADRLCKKFNYTVPDGVREQKMIYENLIDMQSRTIDLTITKVSTLQKPNRAWSWAQVNIGRGYSPY